MDEYDRRYGVRCPVCSKRLRPQSGGKVRRHKREIFAGTFLRTEKCPGSGQPDKK